MATIVTRIAKGSPLTYTEMDANFTNLNNDKIEKSGDTGIGSLVFTDTASHRAATSAGRLVFFGGNTGSDGAQFTLYGKDSVGAGAFVLGAINASGTWIFNGDPAGNLFWGSFALANATGTNASVLGYGTVPVARLGSGSPTSSTVLRGDNTWGTVASTLGYTPISKSGDTGLTGALVWDTTASLSAETTGTTTASFGIFASNSGRSALLSIYANATHGNVEINATSGAAYRAVTFNSGSTTLTWTTFDGFTFNNYSVWHSGNDGAGSSLDSDLLDGQQGAYYRDATNLNAGTVPIARLGSSGTPSTATFLRGDNTWSSTLTGDISIGGNLLGTAASSRIALGTAALTRIGIYSTQAFTDTAANVYGLAMTPSLTNSNTLYRGAYFAASVGTGATVTTVEGVRIQDTGGAGAVTTQYGLIISSMAKGATNWAIYTEGTTNSWFGGNVYARDFIASRGDGTGVIYLNSAQTRYLYYNGTSYQLANAGLSIGGQADVSGNVIAAGSVVINGTGAYQAGAIYTDGNWGMIFRAKQASPGIAQFGFVDSAGAVLAQITGSPGTLLGLSNIAGSTVAATTLVTNLNADLLDGYHGSQLGAYRLSFTAGQSSGGMATATGSLGGLELTNPGGSNAAFMCFHRVGAYAAYFGIDTDNVWKVGGWSMGAAAYTIWHAGNFSYTGRTTSNPTPTAGSGSFTTVSCAIDYQRVGDGYLWTCTITVTTNGTAGAYILVPMPFTASKNSVAMGREKNVTGFMCQGIITASSSNMTVVRYDNGYPAGTGYEIVLTGFTFV